jgi:hypothetical protein
VTVEPGAVTGGTNRLLLPRCEVSARSLSEFEQGLSRAFQACTA